MNSSGKKNQRSHLGGTLLSFMVYYLRVLFSNVFFCYFIFVSASSLKFDFISNIKKTIQMKLNKENSLLNWNNRRRRPDHLRNKQKEDTWTMKRSYHWLNCHPIPVLNLMHSNWLASVFHWHHGGKATNFGWIWKNTKNELYILIPHHRQKQHQQKLEWNPNVLITILHRQIPFNVFHQIVEPMCYRLLLVKRLRPYYALLHWSKMTNNKRD